MEDYQNDNIDDLLFDAKALLDDNVQQHDRKLREKLETEREAAWLGDEQTIIRRGRNDDGMPDWGGEEAPAFVAYNSDFSDDRFRENFSPRQNSVPARGRPAAAAKKPRKKLGCLLSCLLVLIAVGLLLFGAFALFGKPEKENAVRERKDGITTVLLAGTDQSGLRTDTIMLVSIDEKARTYRILSIPRDTLTFAPYAVPKINAAYGYYDGGKTGMDALADLVEDCVGFRPDGYMLIDFNGFASLVDMMGGIDFEVPMDMSVDDISLTAGMQHLNGDEALAVARFRKGYELADLQRIEVQRGLIGAALKQWTTLKNAAKLPAVIKWVHENTVTDLNLLNMAWLGRDLAVCTADGADTLPGEARMIGDGSYFVLDPDAVAALITEKYSPYQDEITADDLYINVG